LIFDSYHEAVCLSGQENEKCKFNVLKGSGSGSSPGVLHEI
jgi:hypothetical protein